MRIHWFKRDLRLGDNPALNLAAQDEVAGLFVIDPKLWESAAPFRRAYLRQSLQSLDEATGGLLIVRVGSPDRVIPALATEIGASEVHAAQDFTPYGVRRGALVESALARSGVALTYTGSPYAVSPGRVMKPDGTPYRVYTPFYRAWLAAGWRRPAEPVRYRWADVRGGSPLGLPPATPEEHLPRGLVAGEDAAWQAWQGFREARLKGYGEDRNRPDLDATSRLSVHLKWGEIHPRSLLAEIGDEPGEEVFRRELAWREFYADVLWHTPRSVSEDLKPNGIAHDVGEVADRRFEAWAEGRTGYPMVDAGMRQLRAEGWMHNRVRMIVASFLIKDLHQPWWRGAAEFMRWLTDGDVASNSHGWQWTAGTGTDASPYFRVFNPVGQGQRFDPEGAYVRRYVPELRHLEGAGVHEPWLHPDGYARGYAERIVDHGAERNEALFRYEQAKPGTR